MLPHPARLLSWLLLAALLTFSTGCDLDELDRHLGKRWILRILAMLEAARDFADHTLDDEVRSQCEVLRGHVDRNGRVGGTQARGGNQQRNPPP